MLGSSINVASHQLRWAAWQDVGLCSSAHLYISYSWSMQIFGALPGILAVYLLSILVR